MALVTEKYQKCRKKLFWENSGILFFWGSQPRFPGEIVHLKITAEKNLFRQQSENHITILKQQMFLKVLKYFF